MNPQRPSKHPVLQKLTAVLVKIIPFCSVVFLIVVITFVLTSKITARKTEITRQQSRDEQVQKPVKNVVTMKMAPALIKETISLPGIARPWISTEAVAEVRGKVIKTIVKEGQPVKTGDLLAVIDKRDYQNVYNTALAAYETAKANEERLTALVRKQFATRSQFDDAVAQVKTTRAALDNAKLSLDRCAVISPIKGIVDRIHIENGSFLNSGDRVADILQMDKLKVEVGIPESDVDAVRNLNSFDIVIDALDGRTYKGYSHYLYKTASSSARLYTLEIRVENPDLKILPDMFARVTMIKNQDPKGLAVPIYAMVTLDNQIGVYAEKNDVVRFRPVSAGFITGWRIQITDGLNPGDHVVVIGHRLIENGDPVNVTKVIENLEELAG